MLPSCCKPVTKIFGGKAEIWGRQLPLPQRPGAIGVKVLLEPKRSEVHRFAYKFTKKFRGNTSNALARGALTLNKDGRVLVP